MGYFPLGHQSHPVGSCLDFSLDFFFATYPALASDFVTVPEELDIKFAGDPSTLPVLPFWWGANSKRAVERQSVVQGKSVVERDRIFESKGVVKRARAG